MSTHDQAAASRAAHYLEPLIAAAILTGRNAAAATEWITRDATTDAEDILRAHGLDDAADQLAELRIEPRLAAESIKFTMTAALADQMSGGTRGEC
jgi:membrane-bound ClpP family serine protease